MDCVDGLTAGAGGWRGRPCPSISPSGAISVQGLVTRKALRRSISAG
jgi:hypothetical protein